MDSTLKFNFKKSIIFLIGIIILSTPIWSFSIEKNRMVVESEHVSFILNGDGSLNIKVKEIAKMPQQIKTLDTNALIEYFIPQNELIDTNSIQITNEQYPEIAFKQITNMNLIKCKDAGTYSINEKDNKIYVCLKQNGNIIYTINYKLLALNTQERQVCESECRVIKKINYMFPVQIEPYVASFSLLVKQPDLIPNNSKECPQDLGWMGSVSDEGFTCTKKDFASPDINTSITLNITLGGIK